MEVVRKAIVVGKCCSMCRTHLQMFSVSTVLGEKASDVVHSRGVSTCPSRQESAWGAAEARQLKVIVEVVRKRIVSGRCCNIS